MINTGRFVADQQLSGQRRFVCVSTVHFSVGLLVTPLRCFVALVTKQNEHQREATIFSRARRDADRAAVQEVGCEQVKTGRNVISPRHRIVFASLYTIVCWRTL